MNTCAQTCSVCGEASSPSKFCPACGYDQRLYSRLLHHTPVAGLGSFGQATVAVIALWAIESTETRQV